MKIVNHNEKMPSGNYVYWIHNDEHTDPFTEGYVGVSQDPPSRLYGHMRNSPFCDDTTRMEILHECETEQESYERERGYRPQRNIGWNIAKGGSGGTSRRYYTDRREMYPNSSTQYGNLDQKEDQKIDQEYENTKTEIRILRDMVNTLTEKCEALQTENILLKKDHNIPVHSDYYAYRYPTT